MTWGAHTFSSQWETWFACGVCSAAPKDRRASSSCATASTKLRAATMICTTCRAPYSQKSPVPTYTYRSSLVGEEQLQRVIMAVLYLLRAQGHLVNRVQHAGVTTTTTTTTHDLPPRSKPNFGTSSRRRSSWCSSCEISRHPTYAWLKWFRSQMTSAQGSFGIGSIAHRESITRPSR